MPKWKNVEYETDKDAAIAMCEDIVWNGEKPEYLLSSDSAVSNLSTQLLLLYAIYEGDMSIILSSETCSSYKSVPVLGLLCDNNPFFAANYRIPIGYEPNIGMHITLIERLRSIYGSYNRRIKTANGLYPFNVVLGYICDTVLFNSESTLFPRFVKMFRVLNANKATSDLANHTCHADIDRLWILYLQIEAGDLYEQDLITVGDLRNARYGCKTKDCVKGDYRKEMLCVSPARQNSYYYAWLEAAVYSPFSTLIVTDWDALFGDKEGKELRPYNMYEAAREYCDSYGVSVDTLRKTLLDENLKSWEAFFRALPIVLRISGHKIDVKKLTAYCKVLESTYGSAQLEYDP